MKNTLTRLLYHIAGKRVAFCIPPYDYIQLLVERELASFLGCTTKSVQRILIVGGYKGYEIHRLLRGYPAAEIHVFEPSQRYYSSLQKTFSNCPRVHVKELAASDACGHADFYETTLRGNGSLLKVGDLSHREFGTEQAETFKVRTTTLDSYLTEAGLDGESVDLLWCDVQGAELKVLAGAKNMLEKCRSIFVEVATFEPTYEGGCVMADIDELIRPRGFSLLELGTHPSLGVGNAFYINVTNR